jgi:hypothetical protein
MLDLLLLTVQTLAASHSSLGPSLHCSLAPTSQSVMIHEPAWIAVTCQNSGEREIKLDFVSGHGIGWRLDPPVVGLSCSSARGLITSQVPPTYVGIPAGGGATVRVLLSRWVRFETPGSFVLSMVSCAEARNPADQGAARLTDAVTLEVMPLDVKRLEKTCEALAQQAISARGDESRQAAEALSWVTLPLAVPYLAQVLNAGAAGSSLAVDGLARIGGAEAASILINAFDKADPFARLSIKNHLRQMQPRLENPELDAKLRYILTHDAVRIVPGDGSHE